MEEEADQSSIALLRQQVKVADLERRQEEQQVLKVVKEVESLHEVMRQRLEQHLRYKEKYEEDKRRQEQPLNLLPSLPSSSCPVLSCPHLSCPLQLCLLLLSPVLSSSSPLPLLLLSSSLILLLLSQIP